MKFGKFSNLSYQEVATNHPSYVTWCRTTLAEDDQTSWRLRRFVHYTIQVEAAGRLGSRADRERGCRECGLEGRSRVEGDAAVCDPARPFQELEGDVTEGSPDGDRLEAL